MTCTIYWVKRKNFFLIPILGTGARQKGKGRGHLAHGDGCKSDLEN